MTTINDEQVLPFALNFMEEVEDVSIEFGTSKTSDTL